MDQNTPVAADKPLPHDSRVVVTNPRAYDGLLPDREADFQKHLAAERDQPAGDDAAVDHVSLGNAILCPSCDGRGEDGDEEGPTNQDCPRCHGHAWFYRHEYVADLRALAEIVRAQRDALLQEEGERAASSVHHDSLVAKLAATNGAMLQVREDNEKLAARVAELEREAEQRVQGNAEARRTLLAELAAERERRERAERTMLRALEPDPALAVARAEADALRREVAALRQYGNKTCTSMADEALAAGQVAP